MKTVLVMLALIATTLSADIKEIKRTIPAKKIHSVDILRFTGSEIDVKTWEKEEISVNIKIEYNASNKEKVQEYLRMVDLTDKESNGKITLTYHDVEKNDDGFSFSDLFNSLFSSYSNLNVSGTIIIPASSALFTDMRYGTYSVEGVKGNLYLSGVSNGLTVRNCSSVQRIENNYGETEIEECAGALDFKGTSSTVKITKLNGTIKADADYSNVTVAHLTGDANIRCISGTVTIEQSAKNVNLDANYSQISVKNTGGSVSIKSQSATIAVSQANNVSINAWYSTIAVESVTGTGSAVELITQSGETKLTNISRTVNIEDSYSTTRVNNIQGKISLDGNTSNLQGRKVTGDLSVTNQYGTVDIEELTASSIEIKNKSNTVQLELLNRPTTVEIENEYGAVILSMPEFTGDVRLKAKYGSISTNLPVNVEEMGGGAIAIGKIGSGTGTMNVSTVSGNIEIRQKK